MIRKYLYGFSAFVLAFVILSVSVLRSSSVSKAYTSASPTPMVVSNLESDLPSIDYFLPYPGGISPDNWLWYLKAARDRIQYEITSDPIKKADLSLLYSDKRLGSSLVLFERNKPDVAVGTLMKGEKYLEQAVKDEETARKKGLDTSSFLLKLANASLKHREVVEKEILPRAPEDLKPEIVKSMDYSKNTYKSSRDALSGKGIIAPKDPFNGQ